MDGYRLLLDSAVYGVFFAAIARCLVLAAALVHAKTPIRAAWVELAGDQSYAGTAFLAFLVSLPAPYVLNGLSAIRQGGIRNAIAQASNQPFHQGTTAKAARGILDAFLDPARAAAIGVTVKRWGSDLDRLLDQASRQLGSNTPKPIMISLRTRKVYVGFVTRTPDLRPADAFFSLLPIWSGYRNATTLSVRFDTRYPLDSTARAPDDFVTSFPIEAIESAHFFDLDLYVSRFGGEAPIEFGPPPDSGTTPSVDPTDITAMANLGLTELIEGQTERAAEWYKLVAATAKSPSDLDGAIGDLKELGEAQPASAAILKELIARRLELSQAGDQPQP